MPTLILVDFNCYPSEFAVEFTERDECLFEWFKGKPNTNENDPITVWDKCGEDAFFYKVQSDDLNHKLKVNQFFRTNYSTKMLASE